MTSEQLKNKLKFLIRWIFSDIVINLRSSKKIWKAQEMHCESVYRYGFEIDESNIGTIQLICIGIETFGRVFRGKKDKRDVSRKCFIEFIKNFFPKEYQAVSEEIYKRYRCGLLHSHILGFKNSFYPNRYNRDPKAKHLYFADKNLKEFLNRPDEQHQRMVLDIDKFYCDFKSAVENFCEKVIVAKQNVENVEKSLGDLPEDKQN